MSQSTYNTFFIVSNILKVEFLCLLGGLFQYSSNHGGYWIHVLTKITIKVFLPCLVFIEIGENITFESIKIIWPILFMPIIFFVLGFLIGNLVAITLGLNYVIFKKAFVLSISSNNSVIFPILIIGEIVKLLTSDDDFSSVYGRSIAYISIYSVIDSLLVYLFGNIYLKDASDLELISSEIDILTQKNDHPFVASEIFPKEIYDSPFIKLKSRWTIFQKLRNLLRKIDGPFSLEFKYLMCSIIFGLSVAFIPELKEIFFRTEKRAVPPLSSITESVRLLGSLTGPIGAIVIGANVFQNYCIGNVLEGGPSSSEYEHITKFTESLNLVIKLIIIPTFGMFSALLFSYFGYITGDPILLIVVMIQVATPCAISFLIAEDELKSSCMRIMCSLIVVQQLFCFATLPTIVVLSVNLIRQ